MRKMLWFALGFAGACAVFGALPVWAMVPVGLFGLLLLPFFRCSGKKNRRWRILAVTGIGLAAGALFCFLFDFLYLSDILQMHETTGSASVLASDYAYDTDYGVAVDGVLEIRGKSCQVRVYLDGAEEIGPGDRLSGTFLFRVTLREGLDSHHPGKGIYLLAYQRGPVCVEKTEAIPWWCFPAFLRQKLCDLLAKAFPQDVSPFAKALLLGDSYALSYETDTALKISGIRHIVAVSGLHVSILYGIVSLIAVKRRFLMALLGFPVLLLFAAMTGFTPSVCRACIMIAVMMLGQLVRREYDPPTALSFASLLLLLANPLVITSAGFQLSVGSVAGILLFQPRLFGWAKERIGKGSGALKKQAAGLASSLSVTLSAMSLTVPLSAGYFGTVSLVGFLMNFLMLWLVELVFVGILLVCIVALLSLGAGAFLGSLLAWPIRIILHAAELVSRFPLAAVYTESIYILAWLVFAYCLIALFLFTGRKAPGTLLCCCVFGLCLAVGASWAEPLLHDCRMTMLDVGQGQCILLQSQGKTWLVDCGGDNGEAAADLAAQTLHSQGITRLDGIIVTHYDSDHFDGVPFLLSRMETELLILPDTEDEGKRARLPEIDGRILYVKEDLEITFGTSRMEIYGPVYSGYSNENSLCVLFDTEKCDILITGDRSAFGERMLLRRRKLPDVDVLVAGHHGAVDSLSDRLLEAVRPETVLISVSRDNPYGHPHRETLERLARYGCAIYRTDQNGTILYRR